MTTALRYTSADLETFPDGGNRYEVIDGELYVSKQPHYHHQFACARLVTYLEMWNMQTGAGQANFAPGIIFADDDDVAPDVIWMSHARKAIVLSDDGKLHAAPEIVVEVLSPGNANTRRDRETKLKLYSRRGVEEYWIVDWLMRQVEVYRREGHALQLAATLLARDELTSPLLPGFSCPVSGLFD